MKASAPPENRKTALLMIRHAFSMQFILSLGALYVFIFSNSRDANRKLFGMAAEEPEEEAAAPLF
jgi:hypothetical protein